MPSSETNTFASETARFLSSMSATRCWTRLVGISCSKLSRNANNSQDMRRDVQEIFRATPTQKQVMMFSATLSQEVRPICKKFMQNPLEIYVDDETKLTLHGLQQYYIKLDEKEKNRRLNELLDELQFNQAIIFVKSTLRATELDKLLKECNFPSVAVHSGVSQEERYVLLIHIILSSQLISVQHQALQGLQRFPRAYLRCN